MSKKLRNKQKGGVMTSEELLEEFITIVSRITCV